jgi:GNAT superfamily N-acetyltransferase
MDELGNTHHLPNYSQDHAAPDTAYENFPIGDGYDTDRDTPSGSRDSVDTSNIGSGYVTSPEAADIDVDSPEPAQGSAPLVAGDASEEVMDIPASRGHELANEPVEAVWIQLSDVGPTIQVSLGGWPIARFDGEFTDARVPGGLEWGYLYVSGSYRVSGVATRLVSALADTAIEHGATTLYGTVESQYTLRAFRHIVPDDSALRYYDTDPNTGQDVELPMTTAQAIMSLELAEQYEPDLENRVRGFEVYIDTTGIDRAALEEPIYINPLL